MDGIDLGHFKLLWQQKNVVEVPNKVPDNPKVSICVQTYNQVAFIKDCLDSIISQKTTFPIEILLAEDESEDGTRSICMDYAQKFPDKIRLFLHYRENNIKILGAPSANFPTIFNLLTARGKYIAICEGDDYWSGSLKLQKQYDFMVNNPEYSICYHDYKIIDSQNNEIDSDKAYPLKQDLSNDELIFPWRHPAPLTIFFKNVFKKIPLEATQVLNLDIFIYTLLGQIGPGKFLDSIDSAFYRVHQQGIWSKIPTETKIISKINTFEIISRFYSLSGKKEISQLFIKKNIKLKRYLFIYYLKKGRFIKAFKYLIWVCQLFIHV